VSTWATKDEGPGIDVRSTSAAGEPPLHAPQAWRRPRGGWLPSPWRREALFVVGAVLVFVVDQLTKSLAVAYLQPAGSIPLVGFLRLSYVENRGAAFGVLQNQTFFFILVGVLVVGGLLASYRYLPTVSPLLNLCLGLQLGGALGNLVDRVRQGYVVDFVDLTWWPVFNVADSAIVVGVCVMAYYLVWTPRSTPPATPPASGATAGGPTASDPS
jgi:signal peptidase II